MAIPLIIWAGYAISAAAVAAATAEVVSGENDSFEPPEALRRLVAAVINWCIGEELVQPEDLTGRRGIDAGLVRIINDRSPVQITTLLDKEQFARDLLQGGAQLLSARAGFPIRSLTDKQMVLEDLTAAGSKIIAEKTGLKLNNMLDRETVVKDVVAFGANHLAVKSGIYLSNPADMDTVKNDLMEWGMEKGAERLVEKLSAVMAGADKNDLRLSALLQKAGMKNLKPTELVRGANSVLLGAADRRYEAVKIETKADRRKKQLREAAARFRARHKDGSPQFNGIIAGMLYHSVAEAKALRRMAREAEAAQPLPGGLLPGSVPTAEEAKKKTLWDKATGKFGGGKEEPSIGRPAVPKGVPMGVNK